MLMIIFKPKLQQQNRIINKNDTKIVNIMINK